MFNKSDFRYISLNMLNEIFEKRMWLSRAAGEHAAAADKEHEDIKKIYELTYGILRNRSLIDYNLSFFLQRFPDNITLQNILRIGYYQLVYMDSIPDYAAINTSVEIAKITGNKGKSGFINGVLRSVARNAGKEKEIKTADRTDYLSVKYSYEKWMIMFLNKYYNNTVLEKVLAAGNEKPPVFFRVNTLTSEPKILQEELKKAGVECAVKEMLPGCLLTVSGDPVNNDLFKAGKYFIQDMSSQCLGHFIRAREGETIIDVGSAPGGKAAYMARDMNNTGRIIAVEPDPERIKLLEENIVRLGVKNTEIKQIDATKETKDFYGIADKVVVDAPCSGLGVIRRHPEKKWILAEDEMKRFPLIQAGILNNTKNWVKPGGSLFYSTCTINPEENEVLIEKFLTENKDYEIADIFDESGFAETGEFAKGKYFLSLPGNSKNMDGFFAAKMNKIK